MIPEDTSREALCRIVDEQQALIQDLLRQLGAHLLSTPHTDSFGSVYFAKPGYSRRGGHGAMFGKRGQLEHLAQALASGLGIRAAARKVGCSKATSAKLHRILVEERRRLGLGDFTCPCGKTSTHRGWCAHRLQGSPRRQQVLATLHARQRAGFKSPGP